MNTIIHKCIIPDGYMKGKEHIIHIFPWDIENQKTCDVCGEVLITDRLLLAALYENALEGSS